jgi:hypothetical protein
MPTLGNCGQERADELDGPGSGRGDRRGAAGGGGHRCGGRASRRAGKVAEPTGAASGEPGPERRGIASRPAVRHLLLLVVYLAAGVAATWPNATYLTGRRLPTVREHQRSQARQQLRRLRRRAPRPVRALSPAGPPRAEPADVDLPVPRPRRGGGHVRRGAQRAGPVRAGRFPAAPQCLAAGPALAGRRGAGARAHAGDREPGLRAARHDPQRRAGIPAHALHLAGARARAVRAARGRPAGPARAGRRRRAGRQRGGLAHPPPPRPACNGSAGPGRVTVAARPARPSRPRRPLP